MCKISHAMIGRQEIYAIFALNLSIIDVMTLQQLRYIIAIDRHRNFARAAAELDITQPTLSSLLQKLENASRLCPPIATPASICPSHSASSIAPDFISSISSLTCGYLCVYSLMNCGSIYGGLTRYGLGRLMPVWQLADTGGTVYWRYRYIQNRSGYISLKVVGVNFLSSSLRTLSMNRCG